MAELKQKTGKYFIYARKSSDREDRQIPSILDQIRELHELPDFEDYQPLETLTEEKTAKKPGRKIFALLVEAIEKDEVRGILCWKLDRLARNGKDGGAIIWAVTELGLKIITPHKIYDRNDLLLMYVEFGMANKFVQDLSDNVKRGNRGKFEKGQTTTMPPPGWMVNKGWKDKGEIRAIKDPVKFPLIKRALDLLLTGNYTAAQVLRTLNDDWGYRTPNGNPLGRTSWYDLLVNPFCYGILERNGEQKKGEHEPMITEEEYWRLQVILGGKGKPRCRTHRFFVDGALRCIKCGRMVTFEPKTKYYKGTGRKVTYVYGYCGGRKKGICDQPSVKLKDIEQQIEDLLSQITISERTKNWCLEYLKELNTKEVEDRAVTHQSLQKTYSGVQQQLDKLLDLRLREQVTGEEYTEKRNELLKTRSQLKVKIDSTEHRADNWRELTEKTFIFAAHAKYRFEKGEPEDKATILTALGSNLLINNGSLEIKMLPAFMAIKEGLERLEPLEKAVGKDKKVVLAAQIREWQTLRWIF